MHMKSIGVGLDQERDLIKSTIDIQVADRVDFPDVMQVEIVRSSAESAYKIVSILGNSLTTLYSKENHLIVSAKT